MARILGPVVRRFGEFFNRRRATLRADKSAICSNSPGIRWACIIRNFGLKLFCLLAFFGIGLVTSFVAVPLIMGVAGLPSDFSTRAILQLLWLVVFSYLGFTGPTFWLRRTVNKRIKQIRKSMPMSWI